MVVVAERWSRAALASLIEVRGNPYLNTDSDLYAGAPLMCSCWDCLLPWSADGR